MLLASPVQYFLLDGNAIFSKLFRLPLGLFTTLYTGKFLTPLPPLHLFSVDLIFLLASLVAFLCAVHHHNTLVRTNLVQHSIPRPRRDEHYALTQDILNHEEFLKLKDYHHHSDHIYDHVNRVSYLSYAIAKALKFDYIAAARGGMLHDFFLYDWRERKANDAKRSTHGKEHPHIALANAKQHFTISDLEADIIVKHMFPKTISLPRYKESLVVSLSDKLAAIYEYCQKCKRS